MTLAYTLDRRDRIVAVTPDWDAFAQANGGAEACAGRVVGARLVDAITGDPARMYMTAILMRVRASGVAEVVPYRCDSDRLKRHYRMTVIPLDGGAVRVEHDLDREEEGAVSVSVRTARFGEPAIQRCSVCCRLKEGEAWRDPFDGGVDRSVRVVHTVCPDCRAAPTRALRRRIHTPRRTA
jgi:hypothetical protein